MREKPTFSSQVSSHLTEIRKTKEFDGAFPMPPQSSIFLNHIASSTKSSAVTLGFRFSRSTPRYSAIIIRQCNHNFQMSVPATKQAGRNGAASAPSADMAPQRNEYITPETKLLSKKREFCDEKDQFENQKHLFKEREKEFKLAEAKIRDKDAEIQESLIKVCKHLHDNESDRLKAKQRCLAEIDSNKEREKEKARVEAELYNERQTKKKIAEKLKNLQKYDNYLKQVIDEHRSLFKDKQELMQRHDTLKTSNDKLEADLIIKEKKLRELKQEYIRKEKAMSDELLQLNNDIASKQKLIEDLETEKLKHEAILEGSKKDHFTETVIIGRIFMAIDNLKGRCQAFNTLIQKSKNLQGSQQPAKKKDSLGNTLLKEQPSQKELANLPAETSKDPNKQPGTPANASQPAAVSQEKKKKDEDKHQGHVEEDKVFNVAAAYKKLSEVMDDMKDYKSLLDKRRGNVDNKEIKKPQQSNIPAQSSKKSVK